MEEYNNVHDFLRVKMSQLKQQGNAVRTTNADNVDTLKDRLYELPHQFFAINNPQQTLFNLPSFKTQPWWFVGEILTEFLNINPPVMSRYRPDLIEQSYKLTEQGVCEYLYGTRWAEHNQIDLARKKLAENPNSKRVLIQTWMPYDVGESRNDVPCNVNYMFLGRDGVLDMTATIRSNDIMRGVKYDYGLASFMQQTLAAQTGMKPGKLYFSVNSLHAYERDMPSIDKIIEELDAKLPLADNQPEHVPASFEIPAYADSKVYWNDLRHVKKAEEASYNGAHNYAMKHIGDISTPLFRDFGRIFGIKNSHGENKDAYRESIELEDTRKWLYG